MPKLNKNTIIGIIVAAVVVMAGIFYLTGQEKKEGVVAPEEGTAPPAPREETEERLSLAGEITSVVPEENYIMVKSSGEGTEVKVILSETTEIIQLKFPFEPGEAPTEGTFTPERLSITIAELEIGNSVLLEVETNLVGKTEISDARRIQVLP